MHHHKFNLKRSALDNRDYIYEKAILPALAAEKVDLREWDSLVESQGNLGSCVGNAIANAYELMVKKIYPESFVELSKLFVYYNSRLIDNDNDINEDDGTTIRSGIKGVKRFGICTEELWPYDITKFSVRPSDQCYAEGKHRSINKYQSLTNINDIIDVINGLRPVVIGIEVFESFMYLTQEDSIVYMPDNNDRSIGGHAMCLVGYDLSTKLFLAKNSFGTDWGDLGYCKIPFDYLKRNSFESWAFDIPPQRVLAETTKYNIENNGVF